MTVVPGDAASLSACARTAREVAFLLAEESVSLRRAVDAVGEGWTGRSSASTRRTGDALAEGAGALAHELDHVGQVLQDHATDLADLVARERAVRERATAHGLEVRDGRVVLGWGVSGSADLTATREQEAARALLQSDLDLVLAQHTRRRDFVLRVLGTSTAALSDVAHRLRHG